MKNYTLTCAGYSPRFRERSKRYLISSDNFFSLIRAKRPFRTRLNSCKFGVFSVLHHPTATQAVCQVNTVTVLISLILADRLVHASERRPLRDCRKCSRLLGLTAATVRTFQPRIPPVLYTAHTHILRTIQYQRLCRRDDIFV